MPISRYKPKETLSPELHSAVKLVLEFSFEAVSFIHETFINLLQPTTTLTAPIEKYKEHWYYYNVTDIIRLAINKLDDRYIEYSYKDTLSNIHYRHPSIPNFVWLLIEATRVVED